MLQGNCDKGWVGQSGHCQDWPMVCITLSGHCVWRDVEILVLWRSGYSQNFWETASVSEMSQGFSGNFSLPSLLQRRNGLMWKNLLKTFESAYKEKGPCRSQMIWVTFPKVCFRWLHFQIFNFRWIYLQKHRSNCLLRIILFSCLWSQIPSRVRDQKLPVTI